MRGVSNDAAGGAVMWALFIRLMIVALVATMLSARFVYAQVPGPLEPTRPSEDLAPPLEPRAMPTPSVPLTREQLAPDRADSMKLTLKAVRIEGAEALSESDLADLWEGYLGQTVSVATLFEIVNAITRRYSEAGYALSIAVLPEQRIEDGVVTIRVVEGYVDTVVFTGDLLTSVLGDGRGDAARNELLERFAAGITASRPLRTDDLERYLLLMNDLPGVTARATFAASRDVPGASTMTVDIARKTVEGQVGFNNHMVSNLGRTRIGGAVALNGQLTGGDQLRLEAWRGTHSDTYAYIAGSYSQMVGGDGLKLGATAAYSNSEPRDGLLADLEYIGRSVSLGFSADYPLIRTRQENLYIGASFDVLNAQSELLDIPFSEDRIRTLGVYTTYDVADETGAVSLVRLGLIQGIDVFGATDDDDPLKSRANGSATFTNLELRALRDQPLVGPWSLYVQAQAQVALGDPLLSAAECSFGGRNIGRGYDVGAMSGDHCLMGGVDLRWTQRLDENLGVQLYGFTDFGLARQKGTLQSGEDRTRDAMSWGGGVRVQVGQRVTGNIEIAKPLDAEFAEDNSRSPRVFVSITTRF